LGENEALFREVNERVRELNAALPPALDTAWTCECSNTRCLELVELAPDEYEAVRAYPERFLVYPDEAHVATDGERVVERHARYWVVEKLGEAARIAEERDPRGD
jgi:hypothetical protein